MFYQNKYMKLLEVSIRRAQLKEEHEGKIRDMFEDSVEESVDENGKSASWYEDMNLPIPDDLKQKSATNILPITDEFFDFKIVSAFIPLGEVSYIAGDFDEGCEVVLKNGDTIKAIDDEIDVYLQIEELTKLTFWQKLKQLFK